MKNNLLFNRLFKKIFYIFVKVVKMFNQNN